MKYSWIYHDKLYRNKIICDIFKQMMKNFQLTIIGNKFYLFVK